MIGLVGAIILALALTGCAAKKPVKPSAIVPPPDQPTDFYHRNNPCNTIDPFMRGDCIKRSDEAI